MFFQIPAYRIRSHTVFPACLKPGFNPYNFYAILADSCRTFSMLLHCLPCFAGEGRRSSEVKRIEHISQWPLGEPCETCFNRVAPSLIDSDRIDIETDT